MLHSRHGVFMVLRFCQTQHLVPGPESSSLVSLSRKIFSVYLPGLYHAFWQKNIYSLKLTFVEGQGWGCPTCSSSHLTCECLQLHQSCPQPLCSSSYSCSSYPVTKSAQKASSRKHHGARRDFFFFITKLSRIDLCHTWFFFCKSH